MIMIENLMIFSKIYDLRGTNARKNLLYVTTSSRFKRFNISSFVKGDRIFARFHCQKSCFFALVCFDVELFSRVG